MAAWAQRSTSVTHRRPGARDSRASAVTSGAPRNSARASYALTVSRSSHALGSNGRWGKRSTVRSVRDFAPFVVFAFILGQFIALFTWTGIGSWLAVKGAQSLESVGFTGFGAILAFALLASVLNLFIVSGSSMWTLLASVFVPLFALLGFEPAFVQAAFRIGDSATQVMTPLNPYMIVLLGFLRRYEPQAGLGTTMARMVPFVVPFMLAWTAVLAIFYFTGVPFGPGTGSRIGG